MPANKTGNKWRRFEAGDNPKRHIQPRTVDGGEWAVIWDGNPKIYFAGYPSNWGGSGWYADPQEVISKPKDKL